MSIIIAFVLIIVFLMKWAYCKTESACFDRSMADEGKTKKEWGDTHQDLSMEGTLESCIERKECYDDICDEVIPILNKTKYWKPIDGNGERGLAFRVEEAASARGYNAKADLVSENKEIALDIMLANRGLVSAESYMSGYPMYFDGTRQDERERYFERACLILELVRKKHPDDTLMNVPGYYVWVNSLEYFSRLHGVESWRPTKFELVKPPEFPKL